MGVTDSQHRRYCEDSQHKWNILPTGVVYRKPAQLVQTASTDGTDSQHRWYRQSVQVVQTFRIDGTAQQHWWYRQPARVVQTASTGDTVQTASTSGTDFQQGLYTECQHTWCRQPALMVQTFSIHMWYSYLSQMVQTVSTVGKTASTRVHTTSTVGTDCQQRCIQTASTVGTDSQYSW
jgi:hypothetical protein